MVVSQSFLATGLRQNENYPLCSRVDPVCLGAHLEINGPVRLFRMRWERQYRKKDWEEGNQEIIEHRNVVVYYLKDNVILKHPF